MVWYGMVWYGSVLYNSVGYGMVEYGMEGTGPRAAVILTRRRNAALGICSFMVPRHSSHSPASLHHIQMVVGNFKKK